MGILTSPKAKVHVDMILSQPEYRITLPGADGYYPLTEDEARELYTALGRLLPSSYYPELAADGGRLNDSVPEPSKPGRLDVQDPTSTSARSQ